MRGAPAAARRPQRTSAFRTSAAERSGPLRLVRGERDALNAEFTTLTAQRQELERQLHDRQFLQEQIAHLKSAPASTRPLPAPRPAVTGTPAKTATAKPAGGTRMELQRNGTVALVPVAPPARR